MEYLLKSREKGGIKSNETDWSERGRSKRTGTDKIGKARRLDQVHAKEGNASQTDKTN